MKIVLIGASGKAGARILKELTDRGHTVTAIARHPEAIPPGPRVTPVACDITDLKGLAELLTGHDAVISAVRFLSADAHILIQAVKQAGVNRLQVVGGAGSLTTAAGTQLVDTPEFPALHKAEATAGRAFLQTLQQEKELDWVFLSPSALFAPGERTGSYRPGGDQLLIGPDGQSRISMEDYAIAMADELETPRHHRRRFTVGY